MYFFVLWIICQAKKKDNRDKRKKKLEYRTIFRCMK